MSVILELPSYSSQQGRSIATIGALQQKFRTGSDADVKIVYNGKTFKFRKAYLRNQSQFFKKIFKENSGAGREAQNKDAPKAQEEYKIQMDASPAEFEKVISCIYGYRHQIKRQEVLTYYQLCRGLQINSLLQVIKKDIQEHFDQYNIFKILSTFFDQGEKQLYNKGIKALEEKKYKQLFTQHEDVLQITNVGAFRNIIKQHNHFKKETKTQISYAYINNLIREYCYKIQKDRPEELYTEMKKQLFNQNLLNSSEYNQIFRNNQSRLLTEKSIRELSAQKKKFAQTHMFPLNSSMVPNRMAGSMMLPSESLLTENIYLSKRVKQLTAQTKDFATEIQNLKKQRNEDEKLRDQCEKVLKHSKMKSQMDSGVLTQIESRVLKLQQQLSQKDKVVQKQNQEIMKLKQQLQKLKLNPGLFKQQDVEDMLVQSAIIPHDYLKGLVKQKVPEQQKPKQQVADQECDRLQFEQPSEIVPKKYYNKLLRIIDSDSLSTYKLTILYRASQMGTRRQDFFQRVGNHNNLLVFIKSKGKIFGGFTSIELTPEQSQYFQDPSSYIFNVIEGRRFKSKSSQPIFISEQYLICFGIDIMIRENCLIQGGSCSWPKQYEGDKGLSCEWLCGSTQFGIQQMQVYEIGSAEMEMQI